MQDMFEGTLYKNTHAHAHAHTHTHTRTHILFYEPQEFHLLF